MAAAAMLFFGPSLKTNQVKKWFLPRAMQNFKPIGQGVIELMPETAYWPPAWIQDGRQKFSEQNF